MDELLAYLLTFTLSSLALTPLIAKICPSIIYNEIEAEKLGGSTSGSPILQSFTVEVMNALDYPR